MVQHEIQGRWTGAGEAELISTIEEAPGLYHTALRLLREQDEYQKMAKKFKKVRPRNKRGGVRQLLKGIKKGLA